MMTDPYHVRVSGPLAVHGHELAGEWIGDHAP